MAITIGTADFSTLTAQPFGYEETETRFGQTARKWLVTGLLRPSEWLSLLDAYDDWRSARIDDEPTEKSGVIGTTISFTGNGPGDQSWTSIPCWFIAAPAAEQLGSYLSVTVELVDANEALEVLIKIKEQEEDAATLSYGAVTIGGSSFPNLTVQPFGYEGTDTKAGQTAKKWTITGLLTPAEWLSLLSTYDGWRDARIQDEPSEISEVVGTTIAFSGTGPGGQSWSNVACWFTAPPSAEQSDDSLSDKVLATVELVDASESLEVLLKEKEDKEAKEDEEAADQAINYGSATIGSVTFPTLTAQPFGYDDANVQLGQTARKWVITGPLTPAEWISLLSAYEGWRDARIQDEPPQVSEAVGTTIALSGTGLGGQVWSNIACWFVKAPSAEQSGAILSASVELVDANEALAALLKARQDKEAEAEAETEAGLPDMGTYTLGGAVLKLLKPLDNYTSPPTLELTALGTHYIQGPFLPYTMKDIQGTTDSAGWSSILAWYAAAVSSSPSTGGYFPITAPSVSVASKIIDGVTTVEYTVSIQIALIV